jgi:hypothetical protein
MPINPALADLVHSSINQMLSKAAAVPIPPPQQQQAGMPPMDPSMMSAVMGGAGGGMPPMDPSMMGDAGGGMPPVDPSMLAELLASAGPAGGADPSQAAPAGEAAAPAAPATPPAPGGDVKEQIRAVLQEEGLVKAKKRKPDEVIADFERKIDALLAHFGIQVPAAPVTSTDSESSSDSKSEAPKSDMPPMGSASSGDGKASKSVDFSSPSGPSMPKSGNVLLSMINKLKR